jgi:hypothetical protein
MKKLIIGMLCFLAGTLLKAQNYPEPEYSNEVYFMTSRDTISLTRLDKESSKMDTKVKMAGFGGAESGYTIEGEKAAVRFPGTVKHNFVFFSGESGLKKSAYMDSMMKANGVDPAAMEAMGMSGDPSKTITLYKTNVDKGSRKIYLQKSGGMFSMKKSGSSDKYTFSLKKIREGYWVLMVDKILPRGEYAFAVSGSASGMDGSVALFAFGID